MKTTKIAALVLTALALPCLAGEPANVLFDPAVSDAKPAQLAGACKVNIMHVADNRPNHQTIGGPHNSMMAEDLVPFASKVLDGLSAYGFKLEHQAAPMDGALNIDARLIRAYTFTASFRLVGMLALDLAVGGVGEGGGLQKFRGSGSKNNMLGATDEHVAALNYAANDLLAKVAVSLAGRCGQRNAQR